MICGMCEGVTAGGSFGFSSFRFVSLGFFGIFERG